MKTFEDGDLNVGVWANPGPFGMRHATQFGKRYRTPDGKWKTNGSIADHEIVRVISLLNDAHRWIEGEHQKHRGAAGSSSENV